MKQDKTDEEDVVKSGLVNISAPVAPCKSLFNGEKVPKVRTKSQGKLYSQLLKNWKLVGLKGLMLTLMMMLLLIKFLSPIITISGARN